MLERIDGLTHAFANLGRIPGQPQVAQEPPLPYQAQQGTQTPTLAYVNPIPRPGPFEHLGSQPGERSVPRARCEDTRGARPRHNRREPEPREASRTPRRQRTRERRSPRVSTDRTPRPSSRHQSRRRGVSCREGSYIPDNPRPEDLRDMYARREPRRYSSADTPSPDDRPRRRHHSHIKRPNDATLVEEMKIFTGTGQFEAWMKKFEQFFSRHRITDPEEKWCLMRRRLSGVNIEDWLDNYETMNPNVEYYTVCAQLLKRFRETKDSGSLLKTLFRMKQKEGQGVLEFADSLEAYYLQCVGPALTNDTNKEELLRSAFRDGLNDTFENRYDVRSQATFEGMKTLAKQAEDDYNSRTRSRHRSDSSPEVMRRKGPGAKVRINYTATSSPRPNLDQIDGAQTHLIAGLTFQPQQAQLHAQAQFCQAQQTQQAQAPRAQNLQFAQRLNYRQIPKSRYQPICNICRNTGHLARECPNRKFPLQNGQRVQRPLNDQFNIPASVVNPNANLVGMSGTAICTVCGIPGHGPSVCPVRICGGCGAQGHSSRECLVTGCTRCGSKDHPRIQCPHRNATCEFCAKKRHIKTECRDWKNALVEAHVKAQNSQCKSTHTTPSQEYLDQETHFDNQGRYFGGAIQQEPQPAVAEIRTNEQLAQRNLCRGRGVP